MTVRTSTGAYPIEFEPLASALRHAEGPAFIVSDRNVVRAWGHAVPTGMQTHVVEPGESAKSLVVYGAALEWLATHGATRATTIVALGGGVVGDLAGFLAATYMRGVRLLQVPTTLLAMVDSSVGGKVGLDLPLGKNLVGAFHPPQRVSVPLETLATLPDRELENGAAEVVKYGFILDATLLETIGDRKVRPGHPKLEEIVRRCIALKAQVVEQDEHETTGLRAILNFGHTIGHAIESVLGYQDLLHGEAIAIGMVAEASLGERLGITARGASALVRQTLQGQGLPVDLPEGLDRGALLAAMRRDKKATQNGLAFALLTGLGACKLVTGIGESDVLAVLGDS